MKTYISIILLSVLIISKVNSQVIDGCATNCLMCADGTVGANAHKNCLTCKGMKPTADATVATVFKCTGTATTGCAYETKDVCLGCTVATHVMKVVTGVTTCVANTGITIGAECEAAKSTDATPATANTVCQLCKGNFKPVITGTPGATCEAQGTLLTNCLGYTAATTCGYCAAGFVVKGDDLGCEAESATNKGCVKTDCGICNWRLNYLSTGFGTPKCTIPAGSGTGSSAKLLTAVALALMIMFNF